MPYQPEGLLTTPSFVPQGSFRQTATVCVTGKTTGPKMNLSLIGPTCQDKSPRQLAKTHLAYYLQTFAFCCDIVATGNHHANQSMPQESSEDDYRNSRKLYK
jgi:hypothetical protein